MRRVALHRRAAGQASYVALAMMAVLGGVAAVGYVKGFFFNMRNVKNGLSANQIATAVTGRVKTALLKEQEDCGPEIRADFRRFRDLTAAPAGIAYQRTGASHPDCLMIADELGLISRAEIGVDEIDTDQDGLWRKVRVSVAVTTKQADGFPRTAKLSRDVKMRIASLNYFQTIFTEAPSEALVAAEEGVTVGFLGSVYYAGATSLPLSKIYPLPRAAADVKVRFAKRFFHRPQALLADGHAAVDMDVFEKAFAEGIETGALDSPVLDAYLPDASTAWNHRFDYFYEYGNLGFPLAELPSGETARVDCDDPSMAYDPARADILALPAPSSGIPVVSATCGPSLESMPAFVQMRSRSDMTIRLTPSDNVFCGLVAAKTLTIRVDSPGTYALFGNFIVSRIRAIGPPGSRILFYNPSEGARVEVDLPAGQSMSRLAAQLKKLSSSTAYNFFLPMAASKPIPPRTPSDYLAPCPSAPGSFTMKPKYEPPAKDAALAVAFNTLRDGSAGPLYLYEESL